MEHAHEIGARVDRVDIEEDLIFAETPGQVIGEPAGIARRIVSPVADEDPWGHGRLGVRPMIRLAQPRDAARVHTSTNRQARALDQWRGISAWQFWRPRNRQDISTT